MKIAILVNSLSISGGNNVLFEHALGLAERGHSVTMLVKGELDPREASWHRGSAKLRWMTLDEAKSVPFDIAVASYWHTCYDLPVVEARRYAYFTQSVESRFYPESDSYHRSLADLTYTMGYDLITEAGWIRDYLLRRYDSEASLVLNGIRKDVFREAGPAHADRDPAKLRLLVEGPLDVGFKNVRKSIELCREGGADEVWLMTSSKASSVAGVDRVFSGVPLDETPLVYRSCDAIVKLSTVEGMFGPPLEMFHCGGTAIVYDVTGHEEYIRNGENALVARLGDEAEVLAFIRSLKADPKLLASLKAGAARTAERWIDWQASTELLEKALLGIADREGSNAREVRTRADLIESLSSSVSEQIDARLEDAFVKLRFKRFLGLVGKYAARKAQRKTGRFI